MKKNRIKYLLALCFCMMTLVLASCGNKDTNRVTDIKYEYDDNGKITNKYEYNSKGNKVRETEIEYSSNGNKKIVTKIEYDKKENEKKKTSTYYDINEKVTDKEVSEYKYDTNGDKTKETYTKYDTNGDIKGKTITLYDSNGESTEYPIFITEVYSGGTKSVDEYEYDKDWHKIERTYTRYYDNGLVIEKYIYKYEYDDNENQIKETKTYYDSNGDISDKTITINEYDTNKNKVKGTSTEYDTNGNIKEKTITIYEYDTNGNKIREMSASYDANENLTGIRETEIEYDLYGDKIKITYTDYDANDNITDKDVFINSNGEFTRYIIKDTYKYFDGTSYVEEYEYDDNWNKTKYTYIEYDVAGNIDEKYVDVYDEDGKCYTIMKTFKYSNDTSYVKEYEYDDNWNKTKYTYIEYNASGNIDEKYVDVYDENGNCERYYIKDTYKYSNGPSYVKEYEYDDNWNETKYTYIEYNASGNIDEKYVDVYDENGKYERYYIKDTYKYSNGTSYDKEYEYDDNWNETKYTYTKYDTSGNIDEKYVLLYDENGEYKKYYIKDTYKYSSGTSYAKEYEYDENWNKTKETTTYYDASGNMTSKGILTSEYDTNGNKTKETRTKYDASGNMTSKYIDVYDEDGKYKSYSIKRTYEYADGTIRVFEYEYDENWNETKWTYTEYDAAGNMTSKEICTSEYNTNGHKTKDTCTNYDAAGNITTKEVYIYDAGDMLKYYIYDYSKSTYTYYDADGNEITESEYENIN